MVEKFAYSKGCWRRLAVITLVVCLGPAGSLAAWHDPMQPQGAGVSTVAQPTVSQAPLRLSSILLSAQRRSAVINGRAVSVGDRIAGYRVQAIEPGRVVLQAGGKQLQLPWRQQKISQAVRQETVE